MTHYKTLVDSDWLGQWSLGGRSEVVVQIASVDRYVPEVQKKKKMPDGTWKNEPAKRLAIGFTGIEKKWLAGPVSQKVLAEMFGPHVEGWIGKKIALYVDPDVKMGNKTVGGLRCRTRPATGAVTESKLDAPVDAGKAASIERAKEEVERGDDPDAY